MKLAVSMRALHPRHVFRISRARRQAVENVFLRVEQDGECGFGEASPNAFYDESATGVAEKLEGLRDFLETLTICHPNDIARCWEEAWPLLAPSRAAQCALDLALWDWLAKREGRSVSELAHGHPAQAVKSFGTIGLSTPEEMREKLVELRDFGAIKIKSDASADLAPMRAARAQSKALLAVDANCAWGAQDLSRLSEELRPLGVAFIEQPFPPGEDARLAPRRHALPILADESCVLEEDVPRVVDRFDGFNVKLVKCGGLTPALRMVEAGRRQGVKTMVGCMLESSVLIAAGLVAAQTTDYADLDGAWLLQDDPAVGLNFQKGMLHAGGPGLGVSLPDDFFAR